MIGQERSSLVRSSRSLVAAVLSVQIAKNVEPRESISAITAMNARARGIEILGSWLIFAISLCAERLSKTRKMSFLRLPQGIRHHLNFRIDGNRLLAFGSDDDVVFKGFAFVLRVYDDVGENMGFGRCVVVIVLEWVGMVVLGLD